MPTITYDLTYMTYIVHLSYRVVTYDIHHIFMGVKKTHENVFHIVLCEGKVEKVLETRFLDTLFEFFNFILLFFLFLFENI